MSTGERAETEIRKMQVFSKKKEVKFLGRVVSEEGYKMDEGNIKVVRELKHFAPGTISDVRQMLGLLGYHRWHFSRTAKPITDLLVKKPDEKEEKAPK